MNILVTGHKGFIGKNLVVALGRDKDQTVYHYDLDSDPEAFEHGLSCADAVMHLAGVNRPERLEAFKEGNTDLTQAICERLKIQGRKPLVVFASSIQATLDNPYGVSKRQAEEALLKFGAETGAPVLIFRLSGVFGKWCRPEYNSVVATFCHHIAHGLPITISDRTREIELVYIDDVVKAFEEEIRGRIPMGGTQPPEYREVKPNYRVTLSGLAERIEFFKAIRESLVAPDLADEFTRKLYATYLSYLPNQDFAYPLRQHVDPRGELAELLKSSHFGQIFVSRTRPGITRGNHYHDTKVEKFVVLDGQAVIRFRHILSDEVIEYPITGRDFKVVDIPPGYTHSIENVGESDLIVLFWADEVFNQEKPDTYFEAVKAKTAEGALS